MFMRITRYLSISALAISITLGCFLLMQRLLHQSDSNVIVHPAITHIKFEDVEIPVHQPKPPRPIKPEHEPPEVPPIDNHIPTTPVKTLTELVDLDVAEGIDGGTKIYQAITDPDAHLNIGDDQLVKMYDLLPPYPPPAAMAGIEGWVKVQFTVNAAGLVTDVVVLESQPARIFDAAAAGAVRKWRFKPRSVHAPSVQAVQLIDFNLRQD